VPFPKKREQKRARGAVQVGSTSCGALKAVFAHGEGVNGAQIRNPNVEILNKPKMRTTEGTVPFSSNEN